MIAHQGGYKERNIFESSLSGGHLHTAFASRKKSKRGVLLQQNKPKSRRRISLNEADLIEEEEEEERKDEGDEDGDGFEDVEEVEDDEEHDRIGTALTSQKLDLVQEQDDGNDGDFEDEGR